MKKLFFNAPDFSAELEQLYRRAPFPKAAEEAAREIIEAVRQEGDAALVRFAAQFDHAQLTPTSFRVTDQELQEAAKKLPSPNKKAIRLALKQIQQFARSTRPRNWHASPRPGVILGEKFTPLDRVGVYIPGGTAPLVSSVIHTAGIAAAAGVKEIIACTPPGGLHPATLYAMREAGVKEIYRLGGVYAIAAMALGTATIPKVEKIAGPGNAYVTAAKKLLYGEVAIDLVAGPSEILIVADDSADPGFIAADMLSQAEHGSGHEQAVLVTPSRELIDAVEAEIILQKINRKRGEAIDRVLANGTFLIHVSDLDAAAELAGRYAPEHLEIQTAHPEKLAGRISAAGAMFLGSWTPEPVGDFCAGPSHVLPTASSARSFNGLETSSFMRRSSLVKYSKSALRREIGVIERFGAMEQLDAHARSGSIRRREKQPLKK